MLLIYASSAIDLKLMILLVNFTLLIYSAKSGSVILQAVIPYQMNFLIA